MAIISGIENSPILVSLINQSDDNGWTISAPNALHSCNAGNIVLTQFAVFPGNTYKTSYIVNSISGGNVQVQSPGSNGVAYTTTGLKSDTITPTSQGAVSIYSNAVCSITGFNIQNITQTPGTTIVFDAINSARYGKPIWSDFRQYYPDYGWSLYTRTIVGYQGALYNFDNGNSASTNNFFGTEFQSYIQIAEAKNPQIIKDFEALSYQANMLLTTTIDGIQTSLGQISTLIDTDFIKQKLASPGEELIIYNVDNVYSASFLGDENDSDIVNGSQLRGNYIIISLITVDGSTPLTLYSIGIRTKTVFVGARP